jgi:hypothetical protein
MNKITTYEGNSITVICSVFNDDGTDTDLSSYTGTLTVKQNKDDTSVLITSTGDVTDNDIEFHISDTDNDLECGVYYYEVTIESIDEKHTVVQDRLIVKQSIVYIT